MQSLGTNPYLTPEEKEMLEMYRKCTPEMKAEFSRRLLLLALEDEEDSEE